MHVRIRIFGKPDTIVVVESKLTKIDQFRIVLKEKFEIDPASQCLFYGGKLLENGYTFHDYNIKLNDVIQLMPRVKPREPLEAEKDESAIADVPKIETLNGNLKYEDTDSELYAIGDFVDVKERSQGSWFEGRVVGIVLDPETNLKKTEANNSANLSSDSEIGYSENSENKPPLGEKSEGSKKKKGIADYFSKTPNKRSSIKEKSKNDEGNSQKVDIGILYKVQWDVDEDDSIIYCNPDEIRPRARTTVEVKDLVIGTTYMVNHNTDLPHELGNWYDFKLDKVNKLRTSFRLVGTLYLGPDAVPQDETRLVILDKIFAIETVVPLCERTEEYKKLIAIEPEKRSQPLNCLSCRDDEDMPCKDCGCYICSGKEFPEKIVLCDECNHGYHMICLDPPLTALPDDDWYCPGCKRDTTDVIAPGAAKQTKKESANKSKRDWGRGMACVGKTKTCEMPANHFGPIPGIEVGMCWRFRMQLSESGVHRPPVSGIHGRDVEGAYSIVLSGGYEDDVDHGIEFTYTGSGGRDLSGNKRTAEQSCDQTLSRENKALARNCAVKEIVLEGGDAGDNWRSGKPVRVVRSFKMMKHFPKYAPTEGIRYDGIYKVVKYYPERGLSGFIVWKYLLRRDDPTPAPWEPDAKCYPIVYPDGYLEAEAEKIALKEINKASKGKNNPKNGKRKILRESNSDPLSDSDGSPPGKKPRARNKKSLLSSPKEVLKVKIPPMFAKRLNKGAAKREDKSLTVKEKAAVAADVLNSKLWDECLVVFDTRGRTEFIEYVSQMFLCIICRQVTVSPITTPCLHNFCTGCLKLAFKSMETKNCPCCRAKLSQAQIEPNDNLKTALQAIMPGYDGCK